MIFIARKLLRSAAPIPNSSKISSVCSPSLAARVRTRIGVRKNLLRSPFSDGYEAAKRLEERGAIFRTPEDALEERIGKLEALFGGFGTILCFVHDWAPRDKMLSPTIYWRATSCRDAKG
jgi:hypothetical protein